MLGDSWRPLSSHRLISFPLSGFLELLLVSSSYLGIRNSHRFVALGWRLTELNRGILARPRQQHTLLRSIQNTEMKGGTLTVATLIAESTPYRM